MRAVGLLFILAGCTILVLPMIGKLLHRTIYISDGQILGGALICVGLAAVILYRKGANT